MIIAIILATLIKSSASCDCADACFNNQCYIGSTTCNEGGGGSGCQGGCLCCLSVCPQDMYNSIFNLRQQLATANQNYQTANGKLSTCNSNLTNTNQNYQSALGTIDTVTKARDTCCNRATTLAKGRDNAISALNAIANVRRRLFINDNHRSFFDDNDDDRRK